MGPVNFVNFQLLFPQGTEKFWHVVSQVGKSDLTLRIGTGVILVWPHDRRMVHDVGIVLLRRVQSLRQDTSLHQKYCTRLRCRPIPLLGHGTMFRSMHSYKIITTAQDIHKHSAHVCFNECMHLIVGLSRSAIRNHCHTLSSATVCRQYCLSKKTLTTTYLEKIMQVSQDACESQYTYWKGNTSLPFCVGLCFTCLMSLAVLRSRHVVCCLGHVVRALSTLGSLKTIRPACLFRRT